MKSTMGGIVMDHRTELLIYFGLAAIWILVYGLIAPPFGGTDVFIFKDAGFNLALGDGLTSIPAPFFDGNPTPRIFCSYVPLYPMVCGVWGVIFGIGPYSSAYLDLVLAIVASFLTLCLLLPIAGRRLDRILCAVILGITAPAGGVFMSTDRPEILGYALGAILLLLWRSAKKSAAGRVCILGATAVVFLANPFAGLLMLGLVSTLVISDGSEPGGTYRSVIERGGQVVAGWLLFACVCASTAVAFYIEDHAALRRFTEHALGSKSGAGVLRNINGTAQFSSFYIAQWRHAFFSSSISSLTMASSLVVCFAIAAPCLVWAASRSHGRARSTRAWLIAILLIGVLLSPVVLFPRQNNYYVLVRAVFPVFICVFQTPVAESLRRVRLPLLLVWVGALFSLPVILLQVVIRMENYDSYKDARNQISAIAAAIDESEYVAITPELYPLVKPVHPKVVDVDYLDRADKAEFVAGLIMGRSGSSYPAQMPVPIPAALANLAWQPLTEPIPPVFIRIFGIRAMRSEWDWGMDGYRRSGAASYR
jgi:hypothetical protein